MIRRQQSFGLHDQINPIQIRIDDDQVVNALKKFTGTHYKFTSIGILFPAPVTNYTEQVFVTCRELNDAKPALINGKLINILGVINLNKINNWDYIKRKGQFLSNICWSILSNVCGSIFE